MSVRQARPEDAGRLQAIQLAAGNAFRDIGMPAAADTFPLPPESLSGYRRAGRAWVAADEHDEPVGFVVADVVDGRAHIEQVSVHPAHAGQRIGAMLLDYVAPTRAVTPRHGCACSANCRRTTAAKTEPSQPRAQSTGGPGGRFAAARPAGGHSPGPAVAKS